MRSVYPLCMAPQGGHLNLLIACLVISLMTSGPMGCSGHATINSACTQDRGNAVSAILAGSSSSDITSMGKRYLRQRSFAEALLCFFRAYEIDRTNAVAAALFAHTLNDFGCFDDAKAILEPMVLNKAVYDPLFQTVVLCEFARTVSGEGEFETAAELARKASGLNPASKMANGYLASILFQKGDISSARIYAEEALRRNKSDSDRVMLAKVFEAEGKIDESISTLRPLFQKAPREIDAWLLPSLLLLSSKQHVPETRQREIAEEIAEHCLVFRIKGGTKLGESRDLTSRQATNEAEAVGSGLNGT